MMENPCQQRRGGGLAVCSGDDQPLFARQKLVVQHLRHRLKWNALIEHTLQFNIAARDRIADDHQVGTRLQIGFAERLRDRNAQRSQEV